MYGTACLPNRGGQADVQASDISMMTSPFLIEVALGRKRLLPVPGACGRARAQAAAGLPQRASRAAGGRGFIVADIAGKAKIRTVRARGGTARTLVTIIRLAGMDGIGEREPIAERTAMPRPAAVPARLAPEARGLEVPNLLSAWAVLCHSCYAIRASGERTGFGPLSRSCFSLL